jgi:pimeloyl-ACP methyl ester carboxylesterase
MKAFLAVAERLPFKPGARSTLKKQAHKGFVLNETFVRLMQVMVANLRTNVLFPKMFTDTELAGIKSDTLVLIGEAELLYDPRFALARALRLIPGAAGELVPNCSHLLIMERPDVVDRAILAFLAHVSRKRVAASS